MFGKKDKDKKKKEQELEEEQQDNETEVVETSSQVESEGIVPPIPPKPIEAKPVEAGRVYNVHYTEEELVSRIESLRGSENINLLLKVQRGQEEYSELQKLISLLPKQK